MDPKEEERIEKLKESLYSKQNAPEIDPDKRSDLSAHDAGVEDDWKKEIRKVGGVDEPRRILGWGKYLLYASVGFLVVAVGVSAFFFLGGLNFLSADNVDVSIVGPVSVGAGEELAYEVIVTNNNSTRLENVKMNVTYPQGARVFGNLESELTRVSQDLRDVAPGETVRTTMKAVLFGEKGSKQNIDVLLQYNLPDSNGVFEKDSTYEVIIESAPLIMSVERPNDIYSNQEIEFVVHLKVNSNAPLEDILLQADYPFGFTFTSSSINPEEESNDLWFFDRLDPEEEVELTIRGRLEGGENDERTVRFTAGTRSFENPKTVSAVFVQQSESVVLRRPLIDLNVVWGTGGVDGVSYMGDGVQGNVEWVNESGDTLRDVEITLEMISDVLNEGSVSVQDGGFYQSNRDLITWNRNTSPELREIQPGERGSLGFRFNTVQPNQSLYFSKRNPQIDITVRSTGERSNNDQFFAEGGTVFSILSDVFLTTRRLHSSGPYPPNVEQQTIYTIEWTVNNSFNSLQNAEVRAELPAYIAWIGPTGNENVTFNPTTREVVWNMGVVKAGVGYASGSRVATFQIGLTPSANQFDSKPLIIDDTMLSGLDSFANKPITVDVNRLNSDADDEVADGRVTK